MEDSILKDPPSQEREDIINSGEQEVQLNTIASCCDKMKGCVPMGFQSKPIGDHPFIMMNKEVWEKIKNNIDQISDLVNLTTYTEDVYYAKDVVKVSWQLRAKPRKR